MPSLEPDKMEMREKESRINITVIGTGFIMSCSIIIIIYSIYKVKKVASLTFSLLMSSFVLAEIPGR